MSALKTIALDTMGGDYGPEAVIPAAAMALDELGDIKFLLFGDEAKIRAELKKRPALDGHVEIIHTGDVVAADEKPSVALRTGRESSMRLALDSVADGRAQAAVSAGNTGALMAMAKFVLKCLPGIHRPAIASVFPTMKDDIVMLDLGANIECTPDNLVQFALLGAVYARIRKGNDFTPTVGILNVGTEDMKGHEEVREAGAALRALDFPGEFKGFIEGTDIPKGTVDVVVTDGFTGNVALKVAEGMGSLTGQFIREAFMSSIFAKIGGLLASRAMKRLKARVDPRRYNGGMFLGLSGICVKSHGSSDAYGLSRAIIVAARLARENYLEKVAAEISHIAEQEDKLPDNMAAEAREQAAR